MSAIEGIVRRAIEAQGPLSIASYMTICSAHPGHGYYARYDPLGAAGDFVTAPEISQLFGELVGAALAQHWIEMGRPALAYLVEAGPGRGTAMTDALRATRTLPEFHAAARVHLIETSPALRALQAERLAGLSPTWHAALTTLPHDAPLLLLANELVDALPVRQLVRTPAGWRERCVALDGAGRLVLAVGGPVLPAGAIAAPTDAIIVEVAPAREAWIAELAGRIGQQGGMALIIDYGDRSLAGDTLQAVRRHGKVDPLAMPGAADLSSHVDFGALARAAMRESARAFGPIEQAVWLDRLGLAARLERLLRDATPGQSEALRLGAERLMSPEQMGTLFKVLAIAAPGGPLPAGFTSADELQPCS